MARKTVATLKAEMAALEAQIAEAEERAAIRVGKIAATEGLLDLDITDAEWKHLFKDFAARFQKRPGPEAQKGAAGKAAAETA